MTENIHKDCDFCKKKFKSDRTNRNYCHTCEKCYHINGLCNKNFKKDECGIQGYCSFECCPQNFIDKLYSACKKCKQLFRNNKGNYCEGCMDFFCRVCKVEYCDKDECQKKYREEYTKTHKCHYCELLKNYYLSECITCDCYFCEECMSFDYTCKECCDKEYVITHQCAQCELLKDYCLNECMTCGLYFCDECIEVIDLEYTFCSSECYSDEYIELISEKVKRPERLKKISLALEKVGLELRSDSNFCKNYIENDDGNIDEIVLRMCQMKYLFEYKDMRKMLVKVNNDQEEELDAGYFPDITVFQQAEWNIMKKKSYPRLWHFPWQKILPVCELFELSRTRKILPEFLATQYNINRCVKKIQRIFIQKLYNPESKFIVKYKEHFQKLVSSLNFK